MTENEIKAIKWIKNVKDDAVVTLNHIAKNEPKVNPMLYAGRKERAETIIKALEELEQYRTIGTVEEIKEILQIISEGQNDVDESDISTGLLHTLLEYAEYAKIGTVEECREARERQRAKKVSNRKLLRDLNGNPYSVRGDCPNCGKIGLLSNTEYCNACGQKLDWSE